jgi:hypothetical protein
MRFVVLGVSAAVAVVACTKVNSADLKTAGMSAHITVTADGTGKTSVSARLNVDTNVTDYVDLSAGDSFSATAGGKTQGMGRDNTLGVISYNTDFTGLDAVDTLYTVALTRANDTSAPASTATLPAPFKITAPTAGATASRAADLTLTWDTTGADAMTYEASGACIKAVFKTAIPSDSGTFVIPKGTIAPTDTSKANDTCQVQITIRRTRNGTLDKAYGYGGDIAAAQTRVVSVSSTP